MPYRVLNDPTHVCTLPDAALYPVHTDIQCNDIIVGGTWPGGRCGKRYTRGKTFWKNTPYWRDFDWGW